MADNARFHNKLHRKNHHTLPTTGYPDSAIDPIASPNEPFQGDFYLTGSLSAQDNAYVGVKLGVRTSNPNYEISVNGSISATQDVFIDRDLFVGRDATVTVNLSSLGNTVLGSTAADGITINAGPINMPNAVNAVDAIIMGWDTNLYRGAANTLRTDDSLLVGINLNVNGNTTLGDTNTDQTVIRGIAKIADSSATNGILFGSGDANYDTNLYRSAANTLRTDDNFIVAANTTLGDANTDQTVIRGITKIADSSSTNGILFGSGDANYDVNLYRKSADILRTDDALEVGGGMTITGDFNVAGNTTLGDTCSDTTTINGNLVINCTTETNGIRFSNGSGGTDTVLFRGAANTLRTNDAFIAGNNLNVIGNTTLGDANTDQTVIRGITKIADSSSTNGILFGSGDANYDTNLYRSTTNTLKTDDNFVVAANTTLGDANTDQTVIRGITKIADSSSTNGILFGTGDANYDTNLYRSAANTLKTDDDMIVDGNLTITGNLTALGTYSRLDTLITGTSSMQIINAGSDLALYVEQKGAADVARFVDDGTTALIVKNGGNVGIGIDSPQGRLHVDGLDNNDSSAEIYITGSCGWMQHHVSLNAGSWNPLVADCDKGIIFSEGTIDTGNLVIAPYSTTSKGIRILADGSVGINVANPSGTLDVRDTQPSIRLITTTNTDYAQFLAANGGGSLKMGVESSTGGSLIANSLPYSGFLGHTGLRALHFGRNNDVDMTIDSAGNVGIDTVTPRVKLEVKGSALITTNASVSGTVTVGTLATSTSDSIIVETGGLLQKRTINSRAWGTTLVDGSGTANYVTKWSDADTITDSIIRDNGSGVGINIAPTTGVALFIGGTARLSRQNGTTEGGEIQFARANDNASTFAIDAFGGTLTPNLRFQNTITALSHFEMSYGGMFGFGTTPNATDRVRINGNINATGTATFGTINDGTTDTVIIADANGTLQKRTISSSVWSGVAGGIVGGSGTTDYIPKWSGSSTLTNSPIYIDTNNNIGINTNTPSATLDVRATSPIIRAIPTTTTNHALLQANNAGGTVTFGIESSTGGDFLAGSSAYSGIITHNSNRDLHFGRNGGIDMTINTSGNVGIGTTTPGTFKLNVNGTFNATGITCTSINTTNGNITMGTGDLTCDTIGCGAITSTTITTNNNTINAGTAAINGGIITGSTLRSTGDVVAYYVSDSRLKENKVPLNNSLEKLQKIEAYSFDWKEVDDNICTRRGHDVGLLAQEVREILPEAILERDNGYLSLDYIKMIPLLVSSIKELKAEIEALKAK
jgi:fibronectin-binding autotransporter adhesin